MDFSVKRFLEEDKNSKAEIEHFCLINYILGDHFREGSPKLDFAVKRLHGRGRGGSRAQNDNFFLINYILGDHFREGSTKAGFCRQAASWEGKGAPEPKMITVA